MDSKEHQHTPLLLRTIRRGMLFVLLASLLGGCFGGSSPERTYYALQYPMGKTLERYAQPRHKDVQIRVRRFESALAYNRQEIVYRSNPHEFKYYWYKLWASRPPKMLRELFANHLRAANIVASVNLNIEERLPEYEVRCEIIALEELNASETDWYAHLAFRVTLLRFEDGEQLWEHLFDERKEVYLHQPVYVVRALSELMEEGMKLTSIGIDEAIARDLKAPPKEPDGASTIQVPENTDPASNPDSQINPDGTHPRDPSQPWSGLKEKNK